MTSHYTEHGKCSSLWQEGYSQDYLYLNKSKSLKLCLGPLTHTKFMCTELLMLYKPNKQHSNPTDKHNNPPDYSTTVSPY